VKIETSALEIASRYLGVEEVEGAVSNPLILAMLRLDNKWPHGDEVAWCSAFTSWVAFQLGLPRSKSLAARSWLNVGQWVPLSEAEPENDVVVLKRGMGNQPGPQVTDGAPGHVGFYAGQGPGYVKVLGGNQGNQVSEARYPVSQVLGVRRLT
jgi:uncharacterized protein (TIGR02594 family)